MPSSVDEQPPGRPGQAGGAQPARRRATGRARTAPRRTTQPVRRGTDEQGTPPDGKAPRSQRKLVIVLSALTAAVVGLGVLVVVINSGSSKTQRAAGPDVATPVTKFNDPATGSTLEYPRSWKRVQVPNATYRLVLDGGNNAGMTLRVFSTAVATTAANLENIKTITDGIVSSNETVKILKQQAIQLNGLIGYYYLYTFNDDSGLPAVHAHYFLFQGRKMNMIVFQSPPDEFQNLAGTFDKVADSFRSDPNIVPENAIEPTTSTTTP